MAIVDGEECPWVPDRDIVLGQQPDDWIGHDRGCIARRLVSDVFDQRPPTPAYDENGVFVQSMERFNITGSYHFYRDDPEAVYAVPFLMEEEVDNHPHRVAMREAQNAGI